MSEVKITILLAVYNSSSFLERCINSLTNQTFKDLEIILINDGSTDGSAEICKQFEAKDSRVKYYSKENGGRCSAINFGYQFVRGEYLLILDSDDYVEPQLCETTYNLAKELNLDIVNYGYIYEQGDSKEIRHSVFPKYKILSKKDFKEILKKNSYSSKILWFTWTNLIKKELLDTYSIVHDENLKVGTDSTFNLQCYLNAERIYSIEDVFYHYIYNPESLTQRKYKPELTTNIHNQFNAKLNLYKKYKLEDADYMQDFSKYYIEHSLFFILNNEKNHSEGFNNKRLNEIRNLDIFKHCFKYYEPSNECSIRMKLIIWCFKNRLYGPIKYLLSI